MALELCYLANGSINGVLRFGQKPWDLAAGLLIGENSSTILETISGKHWGYEVQKYNKEYYGDILGASNASVKEVLRDIISPTS